MKKEGKFLWIKYDEEYPLRSQLRAYLILTGFLILGGLINLVTKGVTLVGSTWARQFSWSQYEL